MYKNIIFDLGGVVINFTPKDFLMDRFMNKKAEEIVYALPSAAKSGKIWTGATFPAERQTASCWKRRPLRPHL